MAWKPARPSAVWVSGLRCQVDGAGQSLAEVRRHADARGDALHRIAVDVEHAGVRIAFEEGGEARRVETLQHPVFPRPAMLDCLQHHPVDAVLRRWVRGQATDDHAHRYAPPGGRGQHAKIEGPGALVLGQAVAQHVVVGVAAQPVRQARIDLAPFRVGLRAAWIVRRGQARRGRGVHHLPEAQRACIGVDREQCMQQRGPRARLAGDDERSRDQLLVEAILQVVVEEAQPVAQQPVNVGRGDAFALGIHVGAAYQLHGRGEALRERGVAPVAEASRGFGGDEQCSGVERIGHVQFPPVSLINSSSASRTLRAESAPYARPAMPP
jgi:hypothetical protein